MLEVSSLTKKFGSKHALNELSFSVDSGEIIAFVGPNGAGKSTLFKILAGVLQASDGSSALDGCSLSSLPLNSLGYLPEELFQYERFTSEQTLLFEITMRDINLRDGDLDTLIQRFAVDNYLHEKMGTLSQGMAKRIALMCAFLGTPRVIILDEPLNGLDIQTVIALREQLSMEKQHGAHILISSHILSFVDETADRIIFLKEGRLADNITGRSTQAEKIYTQLFLE